MPWRWGRRKGVLLAFRGSYWKWAATSGRDGGFEKGRLALADARVRVQTCAHRSRIQVSSRLEFFTCLRRDAVREPEALERKQLSAVAYLRHFATREAEQQVPLDPSDRSFDVTIR